jgi:hypothetical protein
LEQKEKCGHGVRKNDLVINNNIESRGSNLMYTQEKELSMISSIINFMGHDLAIIVM